MPLNGTIASGPNQALHDGFEWQAGPTESDQALYPSVFSGPIAAASLSDALALVQRPGRRQLLTVSVAMGVAPAPGAFSGDLIGSVDGVNYVPLWSTNVAANVIQVGIEAQGIRFVKFRVNNLDQGTATPLISQG